MGTLEFSFQFASTYRYPAAAIIETLARQGGIAVVWKPFLPRTILQRQGWNDSPFDTFPALGWLMSRDLDRICRSPGLGQGAS